jgi:hypothetical protein
MNLLWLSYFVVYYGIFTYFVRYIAVRYLRSKYEFKLETVIQKF